MKKNILIFLIAVFMLAGFNLFDAASNNVYAGTIRICLDDTTCNPDSRYTCYLYMVGSDEPVGSCECILNRCCDIQVDALGTYYFKITDDTVTCTGNTFQYNGEPLLIVNFSCTNCY